jgi:hypothetical protein
MLNLHQFLPSTCLECMVVDREVYLLLVVELSLSVLVFVEITDAC